MVIESANAAPHLVMTRCEFYRQIALVPGFSAPLQPQITCPKLLFSITS
jgi:hypothetical protein